MRKGRNKINKSHKIKNFKPKLSQVALLILDSLGEAFIGSFWPHPYYHAFCGDHSKKSFLNAVDRLKRKGLILHQRLSGGKIGYYLSEEGEKLAQEAFIRFEMLKPRKWDGKWRLLIFDIPEKTRAKRDFFRRELANFGFFKLQKSVWVYPHPIPQEFFDLWSDFKFGNQLIFLKEARIEEDRELRRNFGL